MSEGDTEQDSTQDNIGRSPGDDRTARRILDDWLAAAPPEEVAIARAAAIPHTFDLPLLAALLGERSDLPAAVQRLQRAQILIPVDDRRFTVQSTLRELLIQEWQADRLVAYRQAGAQAAAYLYGRLHQTRGQELEYIYHLLAADEGQGFELLAYAFEQAWSQHQLGRAEQLLAYALEQAPTLSATAQAWLRYFEARLDLAYGRYQKGEAILRSISGTEALSDQEGDPYLRAQALISLATILISTQRWHEAFICLDKAGALYRQVGDQYQLAKLHEAQGAAYVHLATALGGLAEADPTFESLLRRWKDRFLHAPFLLYRWFSRRINLLPNLYFGTNYQDWFIIRLYNEAIRCYKEACSLLSSLESPADEVDINIRLADLQHIVGCWKLAESKFAELTGSPLVQANEYRQAALHLAMGRAALARKRPAEARAYLKQAYDTFQKYEDLPSSIVTGRLLGSAELAGGNTGEAAQIYLESGETARNSSNFLAATDILWILTHLQEQDQLNAGLDQEIDNFRGSFQERAYIARFPGELLAHFRTWAAYIIAPLIFILIWFLVNQATLIIIALGTLIQISLHDSAPIVDLGFGILFFAAVILLMVWGYELLYAATGWRYANKLPVEEVARHQPKYVLMRAETLFMRDQQGKQRALPWSNVKEAISVDRAFWRSPAALYSRLILTSELSSELVLEGIFRHYGNLKSDVRNFLGRINKTPAAINLNYSFFRSWWTLVALILTLIMAGVTLTDLLDNTYSRPNIIITTLRKSNYAYVIDDEGDFWVMDFRTPWQPKKGHEPGFPWQAASVTLDGPYAYIAAGEDGLRILSLEDRGNPLEVGDMDTGGFAEDVAIAGLVAYIADGPGGLVIADITNPADPAQTGRQIDTPGYAWAVETYPDDSAKPSHLFLADGRKGLRIFSLPAPSQAVELQLWGEDAANVTELAVQDNYAYIIDEEIGLLALDITDPANPVETDRLERPGLNHLVLFGPFALLTESAGWLRIVNIADPANLDEIKAIKTPGPVSGLALSEGVSFAYIGFTNNGQSGILVYDVLNPELTEDEPQDTLKGITAREITVQPSYELPYTSLLAQVLVWGRFFFPIFALIRLLYNRRQVSQILKKPIRLREQLPTLVPLLILIILMGRQVYILTK